MRGSRSAPPRTSTRAWKGSGPRGTLVPCDDKRAAASFSAALLTAVLMPLVQNWREHKRDSFPLSYYPMFSVERKKRYRVTHLVGRSASGGRVPIPYGYAGTGGLNQVRRQLSRIVAGGGADAICRSVAGKVARRGSPSLVGVVEVELVTGEYRLNGYFRGSTDPTRVVVHASSPVERQA